MAVAHRHQFGGDAAIAVRGHISRGDPTLVLQVGGEIDRIALLEHDAVFHPPEGGFNKAVFVHPGVGGQRADQAGVGAFRSFDRANPTVVGWVDVAHGKAGPLAGETPGAEGADAALVGELSQGIGLVHELAQLAGAKELLDRRHQRFGVHQLGRGERIGFTHGHPLFDDPLEPIQANPHLVLQQFTHGAHAAIAQVIDVIEAGAAHIEFQIDQIINRGEHVLGGEGTHRIGNGQSQLFVDLVATNPTEVVALGIEEAAVQQALAATHRGRFAWTQFFIQLKQRLVFRGDALVVGGLNRLLVILGMPQLVEYIVIG